MSEIYRGTKGPTQILPPVNRQIHTAAHTSDPRYRLPGFSIITFDAVHLARPARCARLATPRLSRRPRPARCPTPAALHRLEPDLLPGHSIRPASRLAWLDELELFILVFHECRRGVGTIQHTLVHWRIVRLNQAVLRFPCPSRQPLLWILKSS